MNKYKNIRKNQTMLQITKQILEINQHPMHYRQICRIMLQEVGYSSRGKSPWATLNSLIGRDKDFIKLRGVVKLSKWENKTKKPLILEKSHISAYKFTVKTHQFVSRVEIDVPIGRVLSLQISLL